MAEIYMNLKVDASQLIGALKKVEKSLEELNNAEVFVINENKVKQSRGDFMDFMLRIFAVKDVLFSRSFRLITYDLKGNTKSKTNFNIRKDDTH